MPSLSRYDLKNSKNKGLTCILIETDALLDVFYRDKYGQQQVNDSNLLMIVVII